MVLAFLLILTFNFYKPFFFLSRPHSGWDPKPSTVDIMMGVSTKIRDLENEPFVCYLIRGGCPWHYNHSGPFDSLEMQFHSLDAQWYFRKCPTHWRGMKGHRASVLAVVLRFPFPHLVKINLTLTIGQAWFWKVEMSICDTDYGLYHWVFVFQSSGEGKHKLAIATQLT